MLPIKALMKTIVKLCAAAAACGLLLSGARAAAAEAARISGKDAFEILKGFAGEWTGKVAEGEPVPNPSVIYHVTAAQSAVVETLFPGTAHEMVTVYHMDGDKLVMTHYCAAGNQPHMRLAKKSTRTDLLFARTRTCTRPISTSKGRAGSRASGAGSRTANPAKRRSSF
jgi:hypothetical protein